MSTRYYKIGGVDLPSVTMLLEQRDWRFTTYASFKTACAQFQTELLAGRILPQDAEDYIIKLAREIDNSPLVIGEMLHGYIENWANNIFNKTDYEYNYPKDWKFTDELETAIKSFHLFAEKENLKPLLSEQTIWSSTYGYAGKMDMLGKLRGDKFIIDFKTTKAPQIKKGFGALPTYQEHKVQLAAYFKAYNEFRRLKNGKYLIEQKTGRSAPISWTIEKTKKMNHYVGEAVVVYLAKNTPAYRTVVVSGKDLIHYFKFFKCGIDLYKLKQTMPEETIEDDEE